MTYITLQDLLSIAAIAPLMIAAALFVSHLVNCGQRAQTPQPATDDLTDLLTIPASPPPIVPDDLTLPALAKLYSVPGSSKWSNSRKLRKAEREAVLSAICEPISTAIAA
ncbi:hypothetical protein AB3R30_25530 [Leptolyngbyaceae cyanobacterium UHCC 1019]